MGLEAFRLVEQLMTIINSLSSYVGGEAKDILLHVTTLFPDRMNHCDNHCNLPATSRLFLFLYVETAKLNIK